MSSAMSITQAVNPPRAVFLDFPLGHTAGRRDETAEQDDIMRDTLAAFASGQPGQVTSLPYRWAASDDWKDAVMRPKPAGEQSSEKAGHEDDRVARFDTPQYQTGADADAADSTCPTCIFLNDTK